MCDPPPAPKIGKSTRHAKIAGDFGEHLTLYLLSKHGFECARVDHTGLDIIARNPHTGELMGISVKSRSRLLEKTAEDPVGVPAENFKKLARACSAFSCVPYFSFVVDLKDRMSVYIVSEQVLLQIYPNAQNGMAWSMSTSALKKYRTNPNIYRWEITHKIEAWWSKAPISDTPSK